MDDVCLLRLSLVSACAPERNRERELMLDVAMRALSSRLERGDPHDRQPRLTLVQRSTLEPVDSTPTKEEISRVMAALVHGGVA